MNRITIVNGEGDSEELFNIGVSLGSNGLTNTFWSGVYVVATDDPEMQHISDELYDVLTALAFDNDSNMPDNIAVNWEDRIFCVEERNVFITYRYVPYDEL